MSSKRSNSILEDSVDSQPDKKGSKESQMPPNKKKMRAVHPLMASVRSIPDEFSRVPNKPIWLTIACFMEEKEREHIFPNIPELKGIERLAEARVASKGTREYIEYMSERTCGKNVYYVEQKNMDKLFPSGITSFIFAVNDPALKPKRVECPEKPRKPEIPNLSDLNAESCERYKREHRIYTDWQQKRIQNQNHQLWDTEFPERIEKAFVGKNSLYSKNSPIGMLAVSPDENELWFNWGADKCGFPSKEGFNKFCALAGVDPSQPIRRIQFNYCHEKPYLGHSTRYDWISHDRKVTFTSMHIGSYCHYFGCTGVRSRSKFLFEWFKENGSYSEYCWNGRNFI